MWSWYKGLDAHWKILLSLLLAVFAGYLTGKDAALFGVTFNQVFAFFANGFRGVLESVANPKLSASLLQT